MASADSGLPDMERSEPRKEPGRPASKRKRGRRAAWAATGLLLVSVFLWWRHPLRGLPDVGDPPGITELYALSIPEKENAYTYYRRASAQFVQRPRDMMTVPTDWASAGNRTRQWLLDNRPALDLWRKGAARSEALYYNPTKIHAETLLPAVQDLRELARLALLEASRLAEEGDMAGAWEWYRAVLRCSRHVGRHGGLVERRVGQAILHFALEPIEQWAADARTDAALLRQSRHDFDVVEALTSPLSETLRVEYSMWMNSLDDSAGLDPRVWGPYESEPPIIKIGSFRFRWDDVRYSGAGRWASAEPERSRRVLRLIVHNWLAYADLPLEERPPMIDTELWLFDPGPEVAPEARAVPPERLAHHADEALFAPLMLPQHLDDDWYGFNEGGPAGLDLFRQDRVDRARLRAVLNEQLELRNAGAPASASESERPRNESRR